MNSFFHHIFWQHTRNLSVSLFLVCFIFISGLLYSQSDSTNQKVQLSDTLKPVVVTGQFRPQPVDESIYKIEVVDARQIRLKAATNLGEVLKTEPGFNFQSADLLGDFVRIRGLTGEHIKILIDGMPVTGRVYDRIDFGQLTLENVRQIEIIEGPMSVIYGSNALAGVINIITEDYEGKKLFASVNGFYESIGRYNLVGSFARRMNRHTIGFSASRNFFDGWGPVDTSRYKTWKPKLQYTGGMTYKYQHKQLKLTANSDLMNEELRDPGALTLANLYEKALDGYHYTVRWNNRLALTNTFHDNFVVNLQAGYSYFKKKRITYLNDLVNLRRSISVDPSLHDTTSFNMYSARGFISNIAGKKFEYQTGFDLSYESAFGKHTNGHREISDISGFMNFIFRPTKSLSLQPGFRVMHNSNYNAPLVYAFNIKYQPAPFIIKASYARGFRAPSLRQLYLQFVDNNHRIYGNEELKAETADNISFTLNYDLMKNRNSLGVEMGLFFNAIENAIQLALSKSQPGLGKYFNVSETLYKTKGGELQLTFRHSPGVVLSAGLISTGKVRLDNTRKFSWSTDYVISSSWRIRKPDLQMSLFYKYTDEYLEFAGNYDVGGSLDNIGQELTADYHTIDFTLTKDMFNNRINLSLGVKNLLNVTLVNSIGDISIHGSMNDSAVMGYGRTYFISAGYTFSKNNQ